MSLEKQSGKEIRSSEWRKPTGLLVISSGKRFSVQVLIMKKPAIITSIILVILIGFFLFFSNRNTLFTSKGEIIHSSSRTSNWISYQDKKYKYSFKYPPNFGILKERDGWQDIVMPKGFSYMQDANTQIDGEYVHFEFDYKVPNQQALDTLSFVRNSMQKDTSSIIEDIIIDGKRGSELVLKSALLDRPNGRMKLL